MDYTADLMKNIRDLLIADIKRRLIIESVPRIKQCLQELSTQEIWHKPNKNSNSVGNLVLHLIGNVKQYIISGIGSEKDTRERWREFSQGDKISSKDLVTRLDDLMTEVNLVLDKINVSDLVQIKRVQGFEENVISILIHVAEHFSYHTGQIVYYTKYLKDIDLGFYAGIDLDAKSI